MNLELHATPEEVMRAVEALQEFARTQGVPEKMIFGLALALEECGSNIVNHALQRDAQKTVSRRRADKPAMSSSSNCATAGRQFDPTPVAVRKPQPEDDDLPGGWGIQLVAALHGCDQLRRVETAKMFCAW